MHFISTFTSNILPFAAVISVVVFIHEFGHYLVARVCNVEVTDFAIGFGKEIISFVDKRKTRWKICLIPLGGYVKMLGDSNPASFSYQEKNKYNPTSINCKKPHQKILIAIAGPIANFILSFIIFATLSYKFGIVHNPTIVAKVVKGSIADIYGIKENDQIIAVNSKAVDDFKDIKKEILLLNENSVTLSIKRIDHNKKSHIINIPINFEKNMPKVLGITSSVKIYKKASLFESLNYAIFLIYDMSATTLNAISKIFTGKFSYESIAGPIAIAKESSKASSQGFVFFIYFIGLISANLGFVNLLPIPLLDGGHIVINLIEMAIGKELHPFVKKSLFYIGILLIFLMTFIAFKNDIKAINLLIKK
jgi:regulator of sigma E protease